MNSHNCQCDGYLPRHERKGTGKGIWGLVPGWQGEISGLATSLKPSLRPCARPALAHTTRVSPVASPTQQRPACHEIPGKCTRPKEGTGLKMGLYGGVEDRGARGDDVEEENYTNWDVLESNFV